MTGVIRGLRMNKTSNSGVSNYFLDYFNDDY